MRRRNLLVSAGTTVLAGTGLAGPALASPAEAADAPVGTAARGTQDAILATFDTYPIVGGLSPSHGVRNIDEFLISLVCNPRLSDVVTDIVAAEAGTPRSFHS